MRLGDLLIKQNVLTEDELKKALALQKGSGKKIGEVLVDNGFITEDMIVRALQMQLGLKVVQLTGVTIPKEVRVFGYFSKFFRMSAVLRRFDVGSACITGFAPFSSIRFMAAISSSSM